MAGKTATEEEKVVNLKGTPQNPGRDPRKMAPAGKGSLGDKAFVDSLIIVAAAWGIILFLAFSLRHHNV